MAQLVRAPPCHGGGHGFESRLGRYGILAQLGEHLPYKQRVIGSSPIGPITTKVVLDYYAGDRNRTGTSIATRRILSPVRLPVPPRRLANGAYRARTCDPLLVRQMLSQLS